MSFGLQITVCLTLFYLIHRRAAVPLPLKGKARKVTSIANGFPYEGKLSPQVTDEVYAEH